MSSESIRTPSGASGEHIQVLGAVVTLCESAESTDGSFTVLDILAPSGFENGWHTHEPAEMFYLIEGAAEVHLEDGIHRLAPGQTCYVPGGERHGLRVTGDEPARLVATLSPAGFESFLRNVGVSVNERAIPAAREVTEEELQMLFAAGETYGVEFFGPLSSAE